MKRPNVRGRRSGTGLLLLGLALSGISASPVVSQAPLVAPAVLPTAEVPSGAGLRIAKPVPCRTDLASPTPPAPRALVTPRRGGPWIADDPTDDDPTDDETADDETPAADVSAYAAPPGCTRVWVAVSPQAIQVGLLQGSGGFLQLPGYSPGIAQVLVHVDIDGKPAANQTVQLAVRSVPESGGHRHLKGTSYPTAWVQEVSIVTDAGGNARTTLTAGYRGGIETVVARTSLTGVTVEHSANVTIRVPRLVDFGTANGNPPPGPGWPFVYVGATAAHPGTANHYMLSTEVNKMTEILLSAHARMRSLGVASSGWGGNNMCYFRLNDMSLPMGGRFAADGDAVNNVMDAYKPVGNAPAARVARDDKPGRSHIRHDRGLSLDMGRMTTDGCRMNYTIFGIFAARWNGYVHDEGNHVHLELPDPKHPAYIER